MIRVEAVRRTYVRGDERVHALRGVDLEVAPGELVALVGPSGSGKSTLLLVLAGWETVDQGSLSVSGSVPSELGWASLSIVPQALGLIGDLTAEENVLLPARLGRQPARADLEDLLDLLDVTKLRAARSLELSLGEQQRVAVARALVLSPPVILADEPSTHQDADHGRCVFEALRRCADDGAAVVLASHDPAGLVFADRVLQMSDGELRPGPVA